MIDKIKQIVKEEFDADVIEAKSTSGGYSHNMFDVRITKEPFNFILRFSNVSENKDRDLRKEIYVYEQMKKAGIPVPKILLFRKTEGENVPDYAIIQKLPGKRLDILWDSLSLNEKKQLLIKIGKLMKTIHSIKLEKFGRLNGDGSIEESLGFKFKGDDPSARYSSFLRNLYTDNFKDFGRLLSFEEIDPGFALRFFQYILKHKKTIDYQDKPTLIHGDMILGHLFVDRIDGEYQIVGLIDVEFADPSSPEYDFIKLHRQGFFDDVDLKNALIQGYGPINIKAVEVHRIMRDVAFAQVLMFSGGVDKAIEVIKSVDEKIKSDLNEQI